MNQHVIQPAGEVIDPPFSPAPEQEARNMRSLALQLRRNGHQYRQWSREAAAKGQAVAAETFANRAARYSADALWYWKRSRL
jgi:hypothetical protein